MADRPIRTVPALIGRLLPLARLGLVVLGGLLMGSRVAAGSPVWIEAELASNLAGSAHWRAAQDTGASGRKSVIATAPADGDINTVPAKPARLDFDVQFDAPGAYYIHLRGKAGGVVEATNSVRVGFDGELLNGSRELDRFDLGYHWNTAGQSAYPVMAITVANAGRHTVNIWTTEPGFTLDALYVTDARNERPGDRQAIAAATFLDSIGVNTHLTYWGTPYESLEKVQTALDYLGVKNVRDHISTHADAQQRMDALGATGVMFDLFISSNDSLETQLGLMRPRASIIKTIEGPNETDFWPVTRDGLTGFAATRELAKDLYTLVKADPVLGNAGSRIPIIQTSFGKGSSYHEIGDLTRYADYANTHSYYIWGWEPGRDLNSRVREAQLVSRTSEVITTEGGYHTAIGDSEWNAGLTDEVHGKYIPRMLLEQFTSGITRTYLYELFDLLPDPSGADQGRNFGLFNNDGTPKPAATAIHNLTTLLGAKGEMQGAAGTLDYTLTGMPASADDLLLQRADGKFVVVLWNDVYNWGRGATTGVTRPDEAIGLKLDSSQYHVELTDLATGRVSTPAIAADGSVALSLPDSPIALKVVPLAAATTSRLVDRPDTVDAGAIAGGVLVGSKGSNSFFFDVATIEGRKSVAHFEVNDLLVLTERLPDKNNDGLVTPGRDCLLALGSDGAKVKLGGVHPAAGLRFLGMEGDHAIYGSAALRPKKAVEGLLHQADLLSGDAADTRKTVFFFDTALDVPFGRDVVTRFGAKDFLVTTSRLNDAAKGESLLLENGALRMPVATGDAITMQGLSGQPLDAIEFEGSFRRGEVTYFVYGAPGANAGPGDLSDLMF